MRRIILIILLYISIIKITYAIPVPALVIGWDFVVLAIPVILGIFSAIYFYFRKYVFWINIYLFILGVFLYLYHFDLTKEIFLYEKEYLLFLIFIILFGLIYKLKKLKFLNYILVIILIGINFFLVKLDYNLFQFKQIADKVEKNMYSNIKVINILYKDNFVVIYYRDIESLKEGYSVIGLGEQVKECYNIKKYNICNHGDEWLIKGVSSLIYDSID